MSPGSRPNIAGMTEPRAQIAIVDYGMGNLRSVAKALEHVGAEVVVTADHGAIGAADALVLPGVGAFPEAMRRIGERSLDRLIADRVRESVPLLGICLGMQLLFESSTEHGGAPGLGLLPGPVDALRAPGLKLPHIGWSPLRLERNSGLTTGVAEGEPFYFVHSYVARALPEHVVAASDHGEGFAAIVGADNVFGTQFHPEKSSAAGLLMLANFVSIAAPLAVG